MSFITLFLLLKILYFANGNETPSKSNNDFEFKLTVIVLTMNRPHSLARLLKSLKETDFENDTDYFDVEIHVDKSVGLHYKECVE